MVQTLSVRRLHLEYKLWIAELSFNKELLNIYEMNLQDLAKDNPNKDIMPMVEHFQNQFILKKEQIDELMHDLHVSEVQLAALARNRSGPGLANLRLDNHPELRQEMIMFRKLMEELKQEFHQFELKAS
jgi:hypothetical protein